jgi:hypothetical protein
MKLYALITKTVALACCLCLLGGSGCGGKLTGKSAITASGERSETAEALLLSGPQWDAGSAIDDQNCLFESLGVKYPYIGAGLGDFFRFQTAIRPSLRNCLRHSDMSSRETAVLWMCSLGVSEDREYLLNNLNEIILGLSFVSQQTLFKNIASGISANRSELGYERFKEWVALNVFKEYPLYNLFNSAVITLVLDGSPKARTILLQGLDQAKQRNDPIATRHLDRALKVCRSFGEPHFSADLGESVEILNRYSKLFGGSLNITRVTYSAERDAALVELNGASDMEMRHSMTYVATFRMSEGAWKLVYFSIHKIA